MKDRKPFTFLDVLSLAVGTTVSSGIFILPGLAFAAAGPAVYLSYLLAGLVALIEVGNVAELCSAIPETGGKASGEYYFVTHSLGPLLGTIAGIINWMVISFKSAFAIFGIAKILHLLSGFPLMTIALVTCLLLFLMNILAAQKTMRLEAVVMGGLLIFAIFYLISGMSHIAREHFSPFMLHDSKAIFATAGFVFISFSGLLNVTSVAENVKYPRKNLAYGLITAVVIVTAIYVLLTYVTVGVLEPDHLRISFTPIADTALIIGGNTGFLICTMLTLFALLLSATLSMMSASRYPVALSRDNLLPSLFNFTFERFRTPILALLLTGIVIISSFAFPIDIFVKIASTVALTSHVFSCLVIIILRESQIADYQPGFRAPLYPWMQIGGFALGAFLINQMGERCVQLSIGVLILGMYIYAVYGRKKAEQEYVLLHLLTRIVNKELTSSSFDSELRQILYQFDETTSDPFVQLLRVSPVVDILGAAEVEDVFRMIAADLAEKTAMSQEDILNLLMQREHASSTAITPFVAIPHIIVEGQQIFHLFIVRCQHGIRFSHTHQHVKAMFALFGTKDERDRHLKTLAAIARLVQTEDFEKKWRLASNEQQLRDMLILLSKGPRI